MIEIESRNGRLIFKDYNNREVSIAEEDYLSLMADPDRRAIRPALEECLLNPTEVWWMVEDIEGETYSYYKYIKIYRNLVFVAYVLHELGMDFTLNHFLAYDDENIAGAEEERKGKLIKG